MGFSCKLMYVLTMPPLAKARGFTLLALIGGFLELKIGVLKHGVLDPRLFLIKMMCIYFPIKNLNSSKLQGFLSVKMSL